MVRGRLSCNGYGDLSNNLCVYHNTCIVPLLPPPPFFPLQVIRELREEVEKLRLMLTKGGGEEGPVGAGNQELTQLKDKLKISETLMTEMSKSWEQKLAETERIHKVCVGEGGQGDEGVGVAVVVDEGVMVPLGYIGGRMRV